MKKKIAIIGGGIFGLNLLFKLSSKYDCTLFEKNKKLLCEASTNNLNRIHLGYHYPRDPETVNQSKEGYKTFSREYKEAIRVKFKNYYLISKKKSRVSFEKYLNFCKKNNLKYKKANINNFFIKCANISGGIEVNEPIYDWNKIKKIITKRIKQNHLKNKIKLNSNVNKIFLQNEKYIIKTSKNEKLIYDCVINSSYENINKFKPFTIKKKFKYQLTCIFNFYSRKFKNVGLALMDGKFFSFLPKIISASLISETNFLNSFGSEDAF